jgi:hypothetical protein
LLICSNQLRGTLQVAIRNEELGIGQKSFECNH